MEKIVIAGGQRLEGQVRISGAKNAALLATAMLGNKYPEFREAYDRFREQQTDTVLVIFDFPGYTDKHFCFLRTFKGKESILPSKKVNITFIHL